MYALQHTPPQNMTSHERRTEVAALLANGIIRMREQSVAELQNKRLSQRFALGFANQSSVHVNRTSHPHAEIV